MHAAIRAITSSISRTRLTTAASATAALFERVMSASEEFRQFQVNAFRARRTQNVPDLEDRILVPLLAAPMRAASGMSDEVGIVFAAPTPPRLYDLALLFESVTQPRFRPRPRR